MIDLGYMQKGQKFPDTLTAKLIYEHKNKTEKHFSSNDAKEYLNRVTLENGAVYAIGNIKHGFVKIGYSNNPEKRIKQIQTGCPFPVTIIRTWQGMGRKEEKLMHRAYSKYKTVGEWFKIEGSLKHELL